MSRTPDNRLEYARVARRISTLITCVTMFCIGAACTRDSQMSESPAAGSANTVISNEQINKHAFLQCMYEDEYFPKNLVDKGKQILLRLCERIEREKPVDAYGFANADIEDLVATRDW